MSCRSASIEDLFELLSEHDSAYTLASVRAADNRGIELELHVYPTDDSPPQLWYISCKQVWEHRLVLGTKCVLSISSEHPQLWEYIHPRMALYFHGKPASVDETMGALYHVHQETVGTALPFERYLNRMPLHTLLKGGYGLLAQGPEPLVRAYESVLKEHSIPHSFLFHPVSRRSNLPEDKPLQVLEMETSYVICEELEVSAAINACPSEPPMQIKC